MVRGLLVVAVTGSVAPALPLVRAARRAPARARVRALARPDDGHRDLRAPRWVRGPRRAAGAAAGWARDRAARAAAPRRERRHREALVREVPASCDLLRVALGAGSSPRRAIELTARFGPPRMGAELRRVVAQARSGAGTDAALAGLAAHPVPEVAAVARTLRDALALGAPVAEALGRQAAAQRSRLRRRAEAHARTMAVRLLFPLVGVILPAFGLLTVVPTLLGTLRNL